MPETFENLLVKLSRAGVDYLVAGGVAVCLNRFVRTTQDLDLLVEVAPADLRRLLACLAGFGEGFARELSLEDFSLEEGAVRVVGEFTVDLFTVMRSRTFHDFVATARALEVGGATVRFLSAEALIRAEGTVGAPRTIPGYSLGGDTSRTRAPLTSLRTRMASFSMWFSSFGRSIW